MLMRFANREDCVAEQLAGTLARTVPQETVDPAMPVTAKTPAAPSAKQLEALLRLAHREQAEGRFGTAIALYRFALALQPDHLEAAGHLARALFCTEDWTAAWAAFEVRFRLMKDPPRVTGRAPDGEVRPVTRWTEGPPPARLLVMSEQGLGDTLQFARFLPRLADAGIRAAVVADPRLFALLRTLPGRFDLLPSDKPGTVQGIDAWAPMLDLPRLLGIGPDRFAEPMPYLRADPDRIARWRERIGAHGLRVGIAWQGNPKAPVDARRSAPLAVFAPLAALAGIRLISLQRGPGEEQIADVAFADRIETLGPSFDDGPDAFADTAAVLHVLDAVVTVDTALVHVAGALGRPAHLLLQWGWADWRWAARPDDTPWYPSVRLHRQHRAGDWDSAVLSACAALAPPTAPARRMVATPIGVGELIDKLTILDIKAEKIRDPERRANVLHEWRLLAEAVQGLTLDPALTSDLVARLATVNRELWEVEDALRLCEKAGRFDDDFVALARSVYRLNDERAALKRSLNRVTGSDVVEEKSYA
jgi:hypothetical protein